MKGKHVHNYRLLQYAAAAGAFLAAGPATGEVIYTDLDPDQTISGEGAEMMLDINSDGTDDFNFLIYSWTGTVSYSSLVFTYGVKIGIVNALGDNELLGTLQTFSGYSINYMPQLDEGAIIGSTQEFVNGYGTLALSVSVFGFPYYAYGNWSDADMAYMGFRLGLDKQYYYGWMRLSVSESGDIITVHDYAYQTNAGQSITAGQTVGVETPESLQGSVVYSAGQNVYVVPGNALSTELALEILDLHGAVVKSVNGISAAQTLNCSELAAGNYIARLRAGDEVKSIQLFIGE